MKTHYTVALAMLAGIAIGAVAVQGLHAQAKPRAYIVSELEVVDTAANATVVPLIQAAQKAAGGRTFNTGRGKIIALEGAPAPKNVAISEWDSLEQAQAFNNSPAWKNLVPQRDKSSKTIRRYLVEAAN